MKEYICKEEPVYDLDCNITDYDLSIITELIRCKDCRYNADCVCVWHSGNDYTWIVVDDDYCSCAERKEE